METCPGCGSDFTRRITRSWWMRMIPNSKHIHCSRCDERSMVLGAAAVSGERPLIRCLALAAWPSAPRAKEKFEVA